MTDIGEYCRISVTAQPKNRGKLSFDRIHAPYTTLS
jgi:hypothetical protein